ncbi:type I DNA topoisomerase [Candidatus Wolfebacteria bacterium]|nr:type I DNA topoisomerase [Candidatus Wolfebacteria bacterium]
MSKLVIVESPAKAKTIEKYLGDGYTVKASVGHVRDLPKSNRNAIDIEGGFIPHYQIVEKKEKVITELRYEAEDADEVILATDPDREGEAIAWHVAELLGIKKPKRIVFYEITRDAVREALAHPRGIDEHLRRAQEARRVLDRLVGYDLSGLIWKKVRYGLSAGRVQSPALRILMEREREIRAFTPETYWTITAQTKTPKKSALKLTCTEEPRDKKRVDEILAAGAKGPWAVVDVKESEMERKARAPFTTSTLQQTASSRLGFTPSRTMRVAQRLYEAGLITYMRTDSTNLGKPAQTQILRTVENTYGKEYAKAQTYASKSKNAQEAHEAVRPTDMGKTSAGASEEQKKLYRLIWERAAASQMAPARLLKTKITARAGTDEKVPPFIANGSRVLFSGWLAADTGARGEDVELPKVTTGNALTLVKLDTFEKETQPPQRYSEAGLVKELERRGIGRPSTYASIIKTLLDRGYVEKEGRALKPTATGDVVSTFLEENFMKYISDSFTSEMEDELDEIARGEREYEKTLRDFYTPFSKDVKVKAKDARKITNLGAAPKEFPCPKCGKPMVIKLSRNGTFMSCSDFPQCHGARTIEGEELAGDEPIGTHPETSEDIFVLNGPYGPYVQLGEKTAENKKPRRASIPPDKDPKTVTVKDAMRYLSLPRELGKHPESGKMVTATVGRFGPYIAHDGDFRSLKPPKNSGEEDKDDVYTITLERALAILKEPKKPRRGGFKKGSRPKKKNS